MTLERIPKPPKTSYLKTSQRACYSLQELAAPQRPPTLLEYGVFGWSFGSLQNVCVCKSWEGLVCKSWELCMQKTFIVRSYQTPFSNTQLKVLISEKFQKKANLKERDHIKPSRKGPYWVCINQLSCCFVQFADVYSHRLTQSSIRPRLRSSNQEPTRAQCTFA